MLVFHFLNGKWSSILESEARFSNKKKTMTTIAVEPPVVIHQRPSIKLMNFKLNYSLAAQTAADETDPANSSTKPIGRFSLFFNNSISERADGVDFEVSLQLSLSVFSTQKFNCD